MKTLTRLVTMYVVLPKLPHEVVACTGCIYLAASCMDAVSSLFQSMNTLKCPVFRIPDFHIHIKQPLVARRYFYPDLVINCTCLTTLAKNLTHPRCFYVCMSGITEGSVSDPALPRHSPVSGVRHGEGRYSPTATRGQHHTSNRHSDSFQPLSDSRSGVAAHRNPSSLLNRGHTDRFRDFRSETSQDSDDSDSVFSEQPRVNHNASSPRRQLSFPDHHERRSRGLPSRWSVISEPRVEEEEGDFDEDYYEDDHRERRRYFRQSSDSRAGEVRDRRFSHSESVRWRDGTRRDLARTWSCRVNTDKHVRFRDANGASSLDARRGEDGRVWQMLGQVLRERGVPVRISGNGAQLQIWPQSRDGSEASCGDSRPHQSRFQRASAARHSFHGDTRERRLQPCRDGGGRDGGEGRDRAEAEFLRERRGGGGRAEGGSNGHGVRWMTGERRQWREAVEEELSSEEEERQVERRSCRRAPQRSQSLSSSSRHSRALNRRRWPHVAAGNF